MQVEPSQLGRPEDVEQPCPGQQIMRSEPQPMSRLCSTQNATPPSSNDVHSELLVQTGQLPARAEEMGPRVAQAIASAAPEKAMRRFVMPEG